MQCVERACVRGPAAAGRAGPRLRRPDLSYTSVRRSSSPDVRAPGPAAAPARGAGCRWRGCARCWSARSAAGCARHRSRRRVPDVDIDLLQQVLGLGAVALDAQHHREQMRAGALVQLRQRPPIAQPGCAPAAAPVRWLRSDQSLRRHRESSSAARSLQCAATSRMPTQRIHPHPVVPRHQGHRARRLRPAVPGRLQHHRFAAVRRPAGRGRHRPVLHARALRGAAAPGRRGGAADAVRAHARSSSAWTCSCMRWRATPAPAADGQPARPLPERPAVPLAQRPARGRHPGDRLQPPRLRRPGGELRHRLPPPAAARRRDAEAKRAQEQAGRGAGRARTRSTWSCWRATCRS